MPKRLLIWFFFLLLAIVLFLVFRRPATRGVMIPAGVAIQQLEAGNVRTLLIEPDGLTGEFCMPQQIGTGNEWIVQFQCPLPQDHGTGMVMIRYLVDHSRGAKISITNEQSTGSRIFGWFQSFGQSRVKPHKTAP